MKEEMMLRAEERTSDTSTGQRDIIQVDSTGPQIRKWIKKCCSLSLRTAAERTGALTTDQKSTYSVPHTMTRESS